MSLVTEASEFCSKVTYFLLFSTVSARLQTTPRSFPDSLRPDPRGGWRQHLLPPILRLGRADRRRHSSGGTLRLCAPSLQHGRCGKRPRRRTAARGAEHPHCCTPAVGATVKRPAAPGRARHAAVGRAAARRPAAPAAEGARRLGARAGAGALPAAGRAAQGGGWRWAAIALGIPRPRAGGGGRGRLAAR